AIHRAPDLRRDALRDLLAVGDDHALDRVAVARDEAELARAVARGLDLGDLERADVRGLGPRRAGVLAESGHLLPAARAGAVHPAPGLLAAEARPAARHGERLGVGERHRAKVRPGHAACYHAEPPRPTGS